TPLYFVPCRGRKRDSIESRPRIQCARRRNIAGKACRAVNLNLEKLRQGQNLRTARRQGPFSLMFCPIGSRIRPRDGGENSGAFWRQNSQQYVLILCSQNRRLLNGREAAV